MIVGKYIGELLLKLNIKKYFAIPGDYNIKFLDYLESIKGLKAIYCANELNMSYIADGYSRINGFSVFITTFSVGGLSSFNGIAGSHAEDLPVLHISVGPVLSDRLEFHTMHHTIGKINTDYCVDSYKNITIFSERIENKNDVVKIFEKAILLMKKYKKPAYIEIPMNIIKESISVSKIENIIKPKVTEYNNVKIIDEIITNINKSKNPLIIVGTRMKYYKKKLNNLIKKTKFPVCCIPNAKGIISESNLEYIGIYWQKNSNNNVNDYIKKTDFIIYAGCLLNDYNTTGYTHKIINNKTLFLDMDIINYKNISYNIDNLDNVLNTLINKIKKKKNLIKKYICSKPSDKLIKLNKRVTLLSLQKIVERYITNNTTIIVETGTSWIIGIYMKFKKNTNFQIQMQYGSIGWALPATFGCYMANKNKKIILFTGDGSLQMTVQSLSTMVRYNMKGIIFIINNKGYVIEDSIHKGPYNNINNWNYSNLMSVFDPTNKTQTFDIYNNNDLIKALDISIKCNKLYILNCHISRNDIQKELLIWGKDVSKYNNRKSKIYIK